MTMSQQMVKKLSATKQKLSLGEVKKTEKANNAANSRKIVRTTVLNPEDFEWPYITEEDEKELINCLTTDFQVLKLPNYYTPLSVISKIEKGKRREYRHIWHNQRALEVGFDVANYTKLRGDLSIGVNCVSTALELDIVKAVIIDKDVHPPLLTKLLVPIARSKGVPIVAINGLSKTCQLVFKIRCIAMGFKANCGEISHPFYRIHNMIFAITAKKLELSTPSSLLVIPDSIQNAPLVQSVPTPSTTNDEEEEKGAAAGSKRSLGTTLQTFKPPKIRKVQS